MISGERRGGLERTPMAVPPIYLMEDGDKHRWNILQDILGLRAIEQGRVLPELVRDLIDDERRRGVRRGRSSRPRECRPRDRRG